MSVKKHYSMRYTAIAVLFLLVCLVYLGRLFYIQMFEREDDTDNENRFRTVTIQAVRGEIYDRNGKPLVTNQYTYNLTLSYNALTSNLMSQRNMTCLAVVRALEECGEEEKHEEKYFPFEGTYPHYYWSEEAERTDTVVHYRLMRVLSELGLKEDSSVEQIVKYYVSTYSLLEAQDGTRLFDDDDIDRLLRLYYDMDANRFGAENDYVVAQDVSQNLMSYIKEPGLVGPTFTISAKRVYNYEGYASHILGTVGPIYSEEWEYYNEKGYQMSAIVGKSGCERAFESYLHGSDGKLLLEEDANGTVVRTEVLVEPVAGSDVYLTIDIDLQIAAEDGLRDNVAYVVDRATGESTGSGCNAGAAVAMEPETFDVLAIASYPTYNLETYNLLYDELSQNPAKPLLNRALNGTYAPGSTYKLGMSAVALMEGEISASSHINCSGEYPYTNASGGVGCSTYGTTHRGAIDVVRAIAISCNSFFCELGNRLGIEKMEEYMKKFGFGEETGLELGGQTGILAGPTYRAEHQLDVWQTGMTWQAAIGQSDNQAFPLQLSCYIATLVNGRTRYSAHLLHSVYAFGADTPSKVYTQTEETVLSRLNIPADVLDVVSEGMKEVVDESDVIQRWLTSSIPVQVGGKTGTAQTGKSCDNALFVCAAPYKSPDIVISVVLEQGYTGAYAAFTAGRILDAYYGVE